MTMMANHALGEAFHDGVRGWVPGSVLLWSNIKIEFRAAGEMGTLKHSGLNMSFYSTITFVCFNKSFLLIIIGVCSLLLFVNTAYQPAKV